MAIDLKSLPREIQDIVEMREGLDPTFSRFIDCDYNEFFWNMLSERADPNVEHSVIISCVGAQGIGKSLSAISIACFLDPVFSEKNIFFNYSKLVYGRSALKQNTAVIVDEQSQPYGIDAHRVNVVLSQLKEQLRKKSIHFIFCAPVLYPEHETSMYILECMFIDFKEREVYAALKTRDGLTLGHVRIPHPLKILANGKSLATPELIEAYQKKKDIQLETVLGNKDMDIYEESAQKIMKNAFFRKAEKIYVKKMGYIPLRTVVHLINKITPEYNASVISEEVAGRIKVEKETSGEWEIAGRNAKRKEIERKVGGERKMSVRVTRKKEEQKA